VDVGENLGRWAREALVVGIADGFAPAALVEGVNLKVVAGREGLEECVVAVDVVAEAVDED
jgi:hypothetical protein